MSKMSWYGSQIEQKGGFFSHSLLSYNSFSPSESPSLSHNGDDFQKQSPASSSGNKISPAILVIIVVIAVVFFISGLLHLLVRFLMKQRSSSTVSGSIRYPDMSGSDAFQRQLQQLFHLHDSGLDQAVIDALPVFLYKEIMGLKEPFDCAVCLCEFSEKDKLRLLPMCSHAFHIDCIDTWLLSNSSCPLCRGTLFNPGAPFENPIFEFDDTREEEGDSSNGGGNVAFVGQNNRPADSEVANSISRRVFSVRLGKFRSSNCSGDGIGRAAVGESSCSSSLDARRCYSMGSCQYVVSELDLQVALAPTKIAAPGGSFKLLKGRLNGNNSSSADGGDVDGKKLNSRSKGESFSVSKIWQWSRKGKFPDSSGNMGLQLQWNNRVQGI